MGLKGFPHFQEALWQSSEEEHHLSNLISLLVPSLALHPHQEEGSQKEGVLGFHPVLKLLQDVSQARAQLECELVQETWEWFKDMMIGISNWPGDMRGSEHGWWNRQMPLSRGSFPS